MRVAEAYLLAREFVEFRSRLLDHRNVEVGVLPQYEEIVVRLPGLHGVA